MAIRKGRYQSKYVTLPNSTARDTRLSLQARGLLLYLVSLPGDWSVSRKQVAKENRINEKTLQKYINELKELGYVFYVRTTEKGRFSGGDYEVYPEPEIFEEKGKEPSDTKGSTVDPKNYPVEKLPGENQVQHTKERVKQNKETTTTAKPKISEFSDYRDDLVSQIDTRIYIERAIPEDMQEPPVSFIERHADRLFKKYSDNPCPVTAAEYIISDWLKIQGAA